MEVTVPTVLKDGSKISPGANIRKMKQSRLPFQFFSTPAKAPVELGEARKRKPSTEELDVEHVAKAGRVSDVKEHVMTLVAEEENRKPEGGNVEKSANDQVKPSGSTTSNSTKSHSAKKSKRKSDKIDSPKILIKLPIGKRKRSSTDKGKTVKKKAVGGGTLNLSNDRNDSIIVDDSDLSDDGAGETEKNKSLSSKVENETSPKNNPDCATEENEVQISDSAKENTEPADESITESKTIPSLEQSDKAGCTTKGEDLSSESVVALNTTKSLDQSDIIPVGDGSSEVDSSEDIYLLCTPNSKIVPNEEEKKVRKLTPKQIAQRQGYEKRRAQKQQEKLEKRRQLQEEREEKAREKEEQERLRRKEREEKEDQRRREREEKELVKRKDREEREEQKRKEREEKEEQKRKEREEKEKKRQAEIDQKNEEKRLKEEERRKKEEQREEERKRKEEEKEAEEKRKQKVAQAFTSFFVKKSTTGGGVKASDDENSVESALGATTGNGTSLGQQRFMPFCVKGDMRLAPTVRRVLSSAQKDALERVLQIADGKQVTDRTNLYVELLRQNIHNPLKTERTWNADDEEENDEIMIVDENVCHQIEEDPGKMKQKFKTKFFLFEENRRPPYRGTWRKRSACIKARRPFVQDTKFFDYEVDSDEEWEEEEPGESLHGSDDEKDVDTEEDYEVDNEFFVPHGHLSDEEMNAEEEGENEDNSPETQKVKLKIMQQEFVAEMKKKTEKIKPRLIGCIWEKESEDTNRYIECSALIRKMLDDRAMLFNPDEPISFTRSFSKDEQDATSISPSKDNEKPTIKKVKITDDAVRDLARLVHGNVNNRKFLVREFHAFWANRNDSVEFSLLSISDKMKEIAHWGPCTVEGSMQGKLCWVVDENVLQQYDLTDLTLPNEWKYQLQKRNIARQEKKTNSEKESNQSSDAGDGTAKQTNTHPETNIQTSETCAVDVSEKEKAEPTGSVPVQDNAVNGKGNDAVAVTQAKVSTVTKSKKRVPLLMSVPRGQNINQTTKNRLISQFLSKDNSVKTKPVTTDAKNIDNELIEID